MTGLVKSSRCPHDIPQYDAMNLKLPILCIFLWARGSKSALITKNLHKFLRLSKAHFQDKDTVFVQQAYDEVGCTLDETASPHLNLSLQQASSASLMTSHSEDILADSLDCLHS